MTNPRLLDRARRAHRTPARLLAAPRRTRGDRSGGGHALLVRRDTPLARGRRGRSYAARMGRFRVQAGLTVYGLRAADGGGQVRLRH